jgi:ankyrin repeat protein
MKHAPIIAAVLGFAVVPGCARRDADTASPPPLPAATGTSAQPVAPKAKATKAKAVAEPKTVSLFQAASAGVVKDVMHHIERDPGSVNRPNEAGMYAIHLAADRGHTEVIHVLVRAGADVNAPHPEVLACPLQYAATEGHLNAVRTLLDLGANIDAIDSIGRTPLMWAAWHGRGPIVEELLRRGANAQCQTKTGWTALRYAEQKKHDQVAEMLRKQQ